MDKILYNSKYPVYHNLKEAPMQCEAITVQIIGSAYRVYNQMGIGLRDEYGLILIFSERKVEVKRKVRTLK